MGKETLVRLDHDRLGDQLDGSSHRQRDLLRALDSALRTDSPEAWETLKQLGIAIAEAPVQPNSH